MNARLYDPVLHTFLSPDVNITDPSNPQNYNRYAYALNNPLMYVDYSGNDPVTVAIATAAIIGAFIGGVTYVGLSLFNGTAITWGGLAKNIIIGAISGAASGGIGQIMNSANAAICIATQTLSQMQINIILAIPGALMHGISQGIIQGVSGGNAEQSFVSAAISSIAGSGFSMTGSFGKSIVGQSLFASVAGGLTSHFQGGNFWEGAAIGLTVGLLNHAGKKLGEAIDNKMGEINDTVEKINSIFKNGDYETEIGNLMNMEEGTVVRGEALDKYIPKASSIFIKITRIKGGIQFDVKFTASLGMKVAMTKIKDGSVAYINRMSIDDAVRGKLDVIHINSPGNILRKDPFNIYVDKNVYTLPNKNGSYKWYNLRD